MFRTNRVFPGITHITDAMGVSFTLIEGAEKAVLFDTGYGMKDAGAFIRTLTGKPVTVLLSHGHHDHVLGARWFEKTYLCREDMEEFRERTGKAQREKVALQAREQGVAVPDDFMDARIPLPDAIRFTGETAGFESLDEDLGGLEIRVVRVPGHTPGSIVIYVPSCGLLLTGDDWNPCTWMWFPSSLGAKEWRDNMLTLIRGLETGSSTEIRQILCSHQPAPREGEELKRFLAWMTDERMENAPAFETGTAINAHAVRKEPEDWVLLFDRDKI